MKGQKELSKENWKKKFTGKDGDVKKIITFVGK